eukprot:CAMPEP_0194397078 /NCGR_PEP_ID=MMETSP0174-20130528/125345_1 /TAXON_ID=216777 /ORGANISM="Proboscia alata, Strain PI-D3" /LENGTH=734 /DNA_ID=CAMNT_0039193217 /DNA_START=72 /DNA_END=2273 /DNA_ORIENTATION=-
MTLTSISNLVNTSNETESHTKKSYESAQFSAQDDIRTTEIGESANSACAKEELLSNRRDFSWDTGESCYSLGSNSDRTVDRVQDELNDEKSNQCGGVAYDFWEEEQKAVLPQRGNLRMLASFGLQSTTPKDHQTAGDASTAHRSSNFSERSQSLPLDLQLDPADDVGYCLYGVACEDKQRFKFNSTQKKTVQRSSGQTAGENSALEEESSRGYSSSSSSNSSESEPEVQRGPIDDTSEKREYDQDNMSLYMTSARNLISDAIVETIESLTSQRRLVIKEAEEERLALKNQKMPVLDQEEIAARWESLRSTISTSSVDSFGFAKDPTRGRHHVIDLANLQSLAGRGMLDSDCNRHRGLAWRVLSGYLPVDQSTWENILQNDRLTYRNLVQEVFVFPENKDSRSKSNDDGGNESHIFGWMERSKRNIHERDEGSRDTNGNDSFKTKFGEEGLHSCWAVDDDDEALVEEIRRDVSKTHIHLNFFLKEENNLGKRRHAALERLLFVWAKLNKKVKYLNGMSEIAGTIYFVLATDYHEEWAADAEADTYFFFSMLMFELQELFSPEYIESESGIQNWIETYNDMLSLHDPELKSHLDACGTCASFYILPWFATLLCREFSVPDTIRLWDTMFASTNKVVFLKYVCCTMMMLIRDDLLKLTDFNDILELLHNFPPIDVNDVLQSSRALWQFESEIARKCQTNRTTLKRTLASTRPPSGIVMAYGRKGGIAPQLPTTLCKW